MAVTGERKNAGTNGARSHVLLRAADFKTPVRMEPVQPPRVLGMETCRRNCVMRYMLVGGVLALAVGFGSPAFSAKESVDAKFAAQAAKDGMAEVELGKLALDKSNDARVREFADRMIQDHSKANRQLESIAGSKNISLPSKPGEKLQKPMKKLSGLSGKNFDHAYAEAMVKDHEKAVKLFQQCERECTSDELREFAKQTLPILREHLTMARKMVGT
jgi:putative membrane protein